MLSGYYRGYSTQKAVPLENLAGRADIGCIQEAMYRYIRRRGTLQKRTKKLLDMGGNIDIMALRRIRQRNLFLLEQVAYFYHAYMHACIS